MREHEGDHRRKVAKRLQKALDFSCEESVTVPARRALTALTGSCPAGVLARVGLRW
jgi:hypothetical protein